MESDHESIIEESEEEEEEDDFVTPPPKPTYLDMEGETLICRKKTAASNNLKQTTLNFASSSRPTGGRRR